MGRFGNDRTMRTYQSRRVCLAQVLGVLVKDSRFDVAVLVVSPVFDSSRRGADDRRGKLLIAGFLKTKGRILPGLDLEIIG
jgi:hypothetical protein